MLSAGNIENVDKYENMEYFFNDVKYATTSLAKDIRNLKEKYQDGIFDIDYTSMKKRLSEEYNIFMKSTYKFLNYTGFELEYDKVNNYVQKNASIFTEVQKRLEYIIRLQKNLSDYGFVNINTYCQMCNFLSVASSLSNEIAPTRYWFDERKYDFLQELFNESQTKVEEFLQAFRKINQSWSLDILNDENVAALDYYFEKKETGLKLFDLNFHKCKKTIKDLFKDESRTMTEAELDATYANVYTIKRNEYWLSKNKSRIVQFLGYGYKDIETNFAQLRRDYALVEKMSHEFCNQEMHSVLLATFQEEESFLGLIETISQLQEITNNFNITALYRILPSTQEELEQQDIVSLYHVSKKFFEALTSISEDYSVVAAYCKSRNSLGINDMRNALYTLERISQKRRWLKANQEKIDAVFHGIQLDGETDWNSLRDELITKVQEEVAASEESKQSSLELMDEMEYFPTYRSATIEEFQSRYEGKGTKKDALEYILEIESPIKEDILYKKVIQFCSINRITPKIKAELQSILQNVLVNEYKILEDYVYSKTEETLQFRKSEEEKRYIESISNRELKKGILELLTIHYEMTLDDISKSIAYLLQYPRRTKKFTNIVSNVVNEMQRKEEIFRYSGGFRIFEKEF